MPYADEEKQKEYWRQYAAKNKERIKERKRCWLDADPSRRARYAEAQRRRAKADPKKYQRYFRNRHLVTTYGITQDDYERMYKAQGGVCAICGAVPDVFRHGIARLAVDHCHDTECVRGLLCNTCNSGMGLIGDTVEHLEAALAYLKRFEDKKGVNLG